MDFLKWYKHKIETNGIEPPEMVWENIQDELDINESWNKIDRQLKRTSFHNRVKYLSLAASIVAFISLGGYWLVKMNTSTYNSTYSKTEKTIKKQIGVNNPVNDKKIFIAKETTKELSKKTLQEEHVEIQKIKSKYDNITNNRTVAKIVASNIIDDYPNISYAKLNEVGIQLDDTIHKSLRLAGLYKNKTKLDHDESEKNRFNKLYIGGTGQLANTWLLNNKTYEGLEKTNLTSANTSYGYNFGVYLGTNITKNIDLQFDFNILAKNNQNYNEYLNGKYIEDNLTLNYSQIAITSKFYFVSNKFMKGEHGFHFGGYLGYLHSAYQILDNQVINQYNDYNKFDYGVVLGYEYVIPVSNKLGIGTGVKAYYGLHNVYSGNREIPAYLNKTNTASVNFSFSIKYNIKK